MLPVVYPIPLFITLTPITLPLSSPTLPIDAFATAPYPSPLIMISGAVVYPLPAAIIAIDTILPLIIIGCATAPSPEFNLIVGDDAVSYTHLTLPTKA